MGGCTSPKAEGIRWSTRRRSTFNSKRLQISQKKVAALIKERKVMRKKGERMGREKKNDLKRGSKGN